MDTVTNMTPGRAANCSLGLQAPAVCSHLKTLCQCTLMPFCHSLVYENQGMNQANKLARHAPAASLSTRTHSSS